MLGATLSLATALLGTAQAQTPDIAITPQDAFTIAQAAARQDGSQVSGVPVQESPADQASALLETLLGESRACFEHRLRKVLAPEAEVYQAIQKAKDAFWRKSLGYSKDFEQEYRLRGEQGLIRLATGDPAYVYSKHLNSAAKAAFLSRPYVKALRKPLEWEAFKKILKEHAWTVYHAGFEDNNSETIGSDLFIFNFVDYPEEKVSPLLILEVHYCDG